MIRERLEYLRSQIEAECMSYGDIAELQSLAEYIEPEDTVLLEWAGVPEFGPEREAQRRAYEQHKEKRMYEIRRFYANNTDLNGEIVAEGLTLEEAQAHCQDPETSSSTCSTFEGLERTRKFGPWFDGYDEA